MPRNIWPGRQTPVFFGSALTNFGLEPFLQALVELAPPPQPRPSDSGIVSPTDERFTGFVFKIQANMDPRHRDRVAFVRVCSGRFDEGHDAVQQPRGEAAPGVARLPASSAAIARRSASPTPATSSASSTPDSSRSATRCTPARRCGFSDVPRFPAEHFGRVRLQDTRYKQFDEGLRQLEEEGLMQVFYVTAGRREPIVGVVGALQFDVIASRLRTEYGVEVEVEPATLHRRAMAGGPGAEDAAARRSDRGRRWTGRSGACCCLRRSGSCSISSASIPT